MSVDFSSKFILALNNIIDFGPLSRPVNPVISPIAHYSQFVIMTSWNIIDFNAFPSLLFPNIGSTNANSSGPIQFVLNGSSDTVGTIQAYNDGVINIPDITISARFPVKTACDTVITRAGEVNGVWVARPYKMNVIRNGAVIARIRDLYFGTFFNVQENTPNWVLLDYPQFKGVLG